MSNTTSNVTAELWGCPGLTVGVHRYDHGIGAPLWQMAAPPIPEPKFNPHKYLISEKDVRFIIVVNIETDLLPDLNILVADILSVDLYLDGFFVSTYLWDTAKLMRDGTPRVVIFASPANPTTGEVKTFKFSEPAFALDDNNNNEQNLSLDTIKVVVSHALGHMDNQSLPLMEDHTRLFPDNSTVPQRRFPPQITPHVITFQSEAHPARAPAGMMKTATVLRPCSLNFTYGSRTTIESLAGMHIVMPGDRDFPRAAPAPPSHPPQPTRDNNQDRQNALGAQIDDPLVNAGRQMMDILRNYARDHAANMLYHAQRQGALLYPGAPRGPPVPGPSNFIHYQNPPVQSHPGGMGYHQGPPPITGQPLDTGRRRAVEIGELRRFSNGLPIPRPTTMGPPQQPGRHTGLPLASAHPNITTGFTAINSPAGVGQDASAAARAGWEGRRSRATQRDDSQISARGRGHSSGRADSATPRVGASRRRRPTRPTPLADSNALVASGSGAGAGDGVPANRLADGTGAAHSQQALAVTSATGESAAAGGVDQVKRIGKRLADQNSGNVANSAHAPVTSPDPNHTAVPAITSVASDLPVVASGSAALTSGGDDSNANRGAIAEGVTHGASVNKAAANVTKIDDQDSNNADEPATAQDADSSSSPADGAPDGSTSNAAVIVKDTSDSGSASGHSPPYKKQKVD